MDELFITAANWTSAACGCWRNPIEKVTKVVEHLPLLALCAVGPVPDMRSSHL